MLRAVAVLNEALEADPLAVNALFRMRVEVNHDLLEHRTIQCRDGSVSVLGLINGILGVQHDGYGYVASQHEDDHGDILRFSVRQSAVEHKRKTKR